MGLLDMLAGRGGIAAQNQGQSQSQGQLPPPRGDMAWDSGFEGFDKKTQLELMRLMKMRQDQQASMAQHYMTLPIKGYNRQ